MKKLLALFAAALLAGSAMGATSDTTTVQMTVASYMHVNADANLLITGTPSDTGVTGSGTINFTADSNVAWKVTASFAADIGKPAGTTVTLGALTGATGTATDGSAGTVPVSVTATLTDGPMTAKLLGTVTLTISTNP